MRPLAFINGVILFFRWVMVLDPTLDQTVVQGHLPLAELVRDMCIFTLLTAAALAGFWGELRARPWRAKADFVLAVTLLAVLVYFFAEPASRLADLGWLAASSAVAAALFLAAGRMGLGARLARWLGD